MKTHLLLAGIGSLSFALSVPVLAAPQHDQHEAAHGRPAAAPRGKEAGPRYTGTHVVPHYNQPSHPQNNPPHQVVYHNGATNKDEHHAVVIESRPAHVIDRDPRVRVSVRGYHSKRNWGHFHYARGGWFHAWGINAWNDVGIVTCEAANEVNGELYPVTQDRDGNGWDDDTVNSILDQALDDCAAETGPDTCVPATPACSFQRI